MSSAAPRLRRSESADIPVDVTSGPARLQGAPSLSDATSPAPAAIQRPRATPPPAISMAELRAGMQQHLRSSGALKALKTQLRGMVLTELLRQRKHAGKVANSNRVGNNGIALEDFEARRRGTAPHPPKESQRTKRDDGINDSGTHNSRLSSDSSSDHAQQDPSSSNFASWSACVADAVIENHLRRTHRPMSLSIFATEAEVPPLSDTGAPSDEEKCLQQLLLLAPVSDGGRAAGELADDIDNDPSGNGPRSFKKSLLQQLVEQQLLSREAIQKHHEGHRHHCGTQTMEADKHEREHEKNPLLSVECRLAAVDAKYALTFSQLGHHNDKSFFTRAEVDRRLQQYKVDIHEQLRAEYERKYKAYEMNKLRDVKDALEERYQLLIRNKTEELAEAQRSLTVKYEQDRQRLQQAKADMERRAMDLDRREREMRTTLGDHEVELTAHEATLSALKEKLRVAQLQCAKWEELSGSRLMEADNARSRERRRLEDMQRMQAEHAAEMRLKEEELSRLRFRVRMLLNHGQPTGDVAIDNATPGAASTNSAPSRAPYDKMGDDLYRMLVRTEELQRASLDQQRQVQRQQEADLEARMAQQQRNWDATWQEKQGAVQHPRAPSPAVIASVRLPQQQQQPQADPTATRSPASLLSPAKASVAPPVTSASPLDTPAPVPAAAHTSSSSSATSHRASLRSPQQTPVKGNSPASSAHSSSPSAKHSTPGRSPIAAPAAASGSKSTSTSHSKSMSMSKSSGESQPSAARSLESEGKAKEDAGPTRQQQAEAEVAKLVEEEQTARTVVTDDESSNRRGIEWSAKSQLTVLEAQERDRKARRNDSDSSHSSGSSVGRGRNAFLGRMEQQQRETREQEAAQANIIYRDDTDEDDDSILFGGKGSTGSSF